MEATDQYGSVVHKGVEILDGIFSRCLELLSPIPLHYIARKENLVFNFEAFLVQEQDIKRLSRKKNRHQQFYYSLCHSYAGLAWLSTEHTCFSTSGLKKELCFFHSAVHVEIFIWTFYFSLKKYVIGRY